MTARNSLQLFSILVALAAMVIRAPAEDDVTVISTPASTPAPQKKTASADGTTAIHKSSHKKKTATVAAASESSAPAKSAAAPASSTPAKAQVTTTAAVPSVPAKPQGTAATAPKPAPISTTASTTTSAKPSAVASMPTKPQAVATTATANTPSAVATPMTTVSPAASAAVSSPNATPTVETGLPVARYPGTSGAIRGVTTYTAAPTTLTPLPKSGTHGSLIASALPVSMIPLTTSAAGTYSAPPRIAATTAFNFTNFPQKPKTTYPWRSGIITTTFWIGEGDTPISRTTNVQSSWDEDWLSNNRGSDSPNHRNGYAAGNHASTLNPFYVALPFNDLAFPDKSRRYLPAGWNRRPVDGKQISACKDRWVEIKNGKGDICYAQWEDVGPLNYSDAEYVFGGTRPVGMGENHAGLDVSPAVAEYLNISDRNHLTSWRFVDDADVRPGAWLKLDEQAVLYTALHQFKNGRAPTSELPIQRASEPIDENQNKSNKKKVVDSKG